MDKMDKLYECLEKIKWFYVFWFLLFLGILFLLFLFQYQINKPVNINIEGTNSLFSDEGVMKLISEIISDSLNAKIGNLQQSINYISLSTGLFGVLITAVSIFFSLRESDRVDLLVKEVEKIKKEYSKNIAQIQRDRQEYQEAFTSFMTSIKTEYYGSKGGDKSEPIPQPIIEDLDVSKIILPEGFNNKKRKYNGITSNC